jgi:hypothetical protein
MEEEIWTHVISSRQLSGGFRDSSGRGEDRSLLGSGFRFSGALADIGERSDNPIESFREPSRVDSTSRDSFGGHGSGNGTGRSEDGDSGREEALEKHCDWFRIKEVLRKLLYWFLSEEDGRVWKRMVDRRYEVGTGKTLY